MFASNQAHLSERQALSESAHPLPLSHVFVPLGHHHDISCARQDRPDTLSVKRAYGTNIVLLQLSSVPTLGDGWRRAGVRVHAVERAIQRPGVHQRANLIPSWRWVTRLECQTKPRYTRWMEQAISSVDECGAWMIAQYIDNAATECSLCAVVCICVCQNGRLVKRRRPRIPCTIGSGRVRKLLGI